MQTCSQFEQGWDPDPKINGNNPYEYKVPIGSFCASALVRPWQINCNPSVLPQITFYWDDSIGDEKSCQVLMENPYADDNDNDRCIKEMLNSGYPLLGTKSIDMVWIVHGWKNSGATEWLNDMRNSYFKKYKNSAAKKLIVAKVGWQLGAAMKQNPWQDRNEETLKVKLVLKASEYF